MNLGLYFEYFVSCIYAIYYIVIKIIFCYLLCRHDSIIIQEIIERISSELKLIFQSSIPKELVGIESPVMEMLDLYLVEGSGGVRFVGICGMDRMGKTTLALEIYERIFGSFEASSFIANVREKTNNYHLVSLQEQLLSNILRGSRKKYIKCFFRGSML